LISGKLPNVSGFWLGDRMWIIQLINYFFILWRCQLFIQYYI
jgi:hypothetical protein